MLQSARALGQPLAHRRGHEAAAVGLQEGEPEAGGDLAQLRRDRGLRQVQGPAARLTLPSRTTASKLRSCTRLTRGARSRPGGILVSSGVPNQLNQNISLV